MSTINLFITFRWLDAIDILLVSILLYQLYKLVQGTVAINIILGIVSIFLLWKAVEALEMKLLSEILGKFIGVGVIAIIIVFQQEIRKFLLVVGTSRFIQKAGKSKSLFNFSSETEKTDINAIVRSCRHMGESKTGALIIVTTQNSLDFYVKTGETVDSKVSTRVIESIFYKNSPLHDGAVIITNNRIIAARCVLPVTENPEFPPHLGMRHRAAVGITEQSDALGIIVSEQTGEISFAKNGKIRYNVKPEELKVLLESELKQ